MTHPEPTDLLDLARGVLGDSETGPLWLHIDECAACRLSLDRLSLVVKAIASATVPSEAVAGARRLAASLAARPVPAAALSARLLFDNQLHPAAAGVRGPVADRHMLFEAGHWIVDLRFQPREGTIALIGQLANSLTPSQPCPDVPIVARSGQTVVGRAVTTAWGEFSLDCGDVSPLVLEIRVPPPVIEIPLPG